MIARNTPRLVSVVAYILSFEALCLGADYYVDAVGGNDSNSGLGPMAAWKTIAKVNASGFAPGDRVLLKRGLVWREQLVIPSSGTADQPIVFGAYGAGDRPLLRGSAPVQNWTGAGTNIWRASLSTQPNQVFFDAARGTLQSTVQDLDNALEWCWSSGALYVYAGSNPNDLYRDSGVEASVRPSPRNYGLIHIKDREHVTVDGIGVCQSYSYGILIKPWGRHITVSNCEVSHSLDGGIVVPNSGGAAVSQVTLLNCLVHHNNGGFKEGAPGVATYHEGITMELIDGFTIRGCQVYNNYMEGVNFKRGAANGVIEYCSLYANDLINQYIEGASNIEIRYNRIFDCTYNAGIEFGLETNTYHNDNIRIHHNLFWGNSGAVSFWAANVTAQTRNISICNNTFYSNEYAVRWKAAATDNYSGTNSIKNNLIWQRLDWYNGIRDDTAGDQGIGRTAIEFNVFQQGSNSDTLGAHAVVITDPSFRNALSNDFRLQSGSACIDAGTDLGMEKDYEGNRIPQGAAPDIGAYEYASGIRTYALAANAVNGAVTRTPEKTSYMDGETVTLQAVPNAGYAFAGWSGDLTGAANPATLVMDADKSVAAAFTADANTVTISPDPGSVAVTPSSTTIGTDQTRPTLADCLPAPDSIQAPPNTLIAMHVRDAGQGIDPASVSIEVDGNRIYTGDVETCSTAYGICRRLGTPADYTYRYQQSGPFDYSTEVRVAVNAQDRAGNAMPEQTYTFATEMYCFGLHRQIGGDGTRLSQSRPAVANDSRGDLWVVWQEGNAPSRHIYVSHLASDTGGWTAAAQLSRGTGDHCNPAIAIDGAGVLYVVWQENATGRWRVGLSTSANGTDWSAPKAVVESQDNQVNPAVAAGRGSSGLAAIAWQSDEAGQQDIRVAHSTNRFLTAAASGVTSDGADQTDPAIAVDARDTIFVLWTDARNGSMDIYGAASNSGPWTNVPVANTGANESDPVIVAGSTASTVHIVWVDDAAGNLDVRYAASEGSPAAPLAGIGIIDDTSGADQHAPMLAVAARSGKADQVFVCWEDKRNLHSSGDTDLYFAPIGPGSLATNVLVGDAGTNSNQSHASLAVDPHGFPHVVWADDAGGSSRVYGSAATYASPVSAAEREIAAATGGAVGTIPEDIRTIDDVSVVIPAGACSFNTTIRIAPVSNPRSFATEPLRTFDFGPSGLTFTQPAAITIPYDARAAEKVQAYWYDSMTGTLSDRGITDVERIVVTPNLHALRFKTTHFTQFYLVEASAPGVSHDSGGGGCALSPHSRGSILGYFVPYLVIGAAMLLWRRTDSRRR